MVHFLPISPFELTKEDALLLVKIMPFDYDGRTAKDLVEAALAGRIQFWRIQGSMTGLLLTRLTNDREGKTLWIEAIGGSGLSENVTEVVNALRSLALRAGCVTFSGLVERRGMQELVAQVNLPIVAQVFREPVHAES